MAQADVDGPPLHADSSEPIPAAPPNPASLRPEIPGEGATTEDWNKHVKALESSFDSYTQSLMEQGYKITVNKSERTIEVSKKTEGSRKQIGWDNNGDPVYSTEGGGYEYDPTMSASATSKYREFLNASDDATAAKKSISSGAGNVKSYLEVQGEKATAIRRDFLDFMERAESLYSLEDSEQQFAMRADDQNIQNVKAVQEGSMPFGMMTHYTKRLPQEQLSDIMRPAVPEYVPPSYHLGGAAGIPGQPTGFNDPDYDENGMPRYALGTVMNAPGVAAPAGGPAPAPSAPPGRNPWHLGPSRPPNLEGIDEEIAWMVGMPDYPIDPSRAKGGIVYNGPNARLRALAFIQRNGGTV